GSIPRPSLSCWTVTGSSMTMRIASSPARTSGVGSVIVVLPLRGRDGVRLILLRRCGPSPGRVPITRECDGEGAQGLRLVDVAEARGHQFEDREEAGDDDEAGLRILDEGGEVEIGRAHV